MQSQGHSGWYLSISCDRPDVEVLQQTGRLSVAGGDRCSGSVSLEAEGSVEGHQEGEGQARGGVVTRRLMTRGRRRTVRVTNDDRYHEQRC